MKLFKSLLLNVVIILLTTIGLKAQDDGAYYWQVLSKVAYKTTFDEDKVETLYSPVFSRKVKALEGKEIILKGYVIPVEAAEGAFILSAFPYSSCFFCGGAGPESVVEVYPQFPILSRPGKAVLIKGVLELNENDSKHLSYIIRKAVPYVSE